MFVTIVPLFSSRNYTTEIHLFLQQLPGGRGFPGSLRHTPPLFGAMFISAAALAAGHGLPQLLQMDWLAPSPGIWKKMEWSTLIPLSEKGNNLPLVLLVILKQSHSWACWAALEKGCAVFGHSLLVCSAIPQPLVPLQKLHLLSCFALGFGSCPMETSVVQSRVGLEQRWGMLQRAWAVLEPGIDAREALTAQGPH